MLMHLRKDSILGKPYSGELNPVKPNVKVSWGIIEGNEVIPTQDFTWCRDFLIWFLCNIVEPHHERFKEPRAQKIRDYGYKNLLFLMKLMKDSCKPVKDKISNGVGYLNQIETKYGLNCTTILHTDDPDYLVIEGDPFWKKSVLHAGFWTLILRNCMHKDMPDNFTGKDIMKVTGDAVVKYDISWTTPLLRYSDIFDYFPYVLANFSGNFRDTSPGATNLHWNPRNGLLYNMYPSTETRSTLNKECYKLLKEAMTKDPNVQKI
jgi:hypothetical protein